MIVITTPSCLIGHQVLDNLLDSGEELRVVTRIRRLSRLLDLQLQPVERFPQHIDFLGSQGD